MTPFIPSPKARTRYAGTPAAPTPTAARDFPGCDAVSLPTWKDVWAYDGRIEYWSRETGTAWVMRDAGPVHENAPNLLSELLTRMCLERGSRFLLAGAVYLMERDTDGRPRQVLVGDQTIYLDRRVWRPRDPAIVLGVDPLPDVILEVDHTTDVRRNKLPVYEAWGFPEVWVDTPDKSSPNRPRGLRPGLTIYVLDGGRFRTVDESRAFPTWTAAQIHASLNEPRLGPRTLGDLTRVGRRLGESEGTTPDDDPQLGRHRRQARAEGIAQGRAEGVAQARAEGIARERALLRRLAAQKFGPAAAARTAEALARIEDPRSLTEAFDLITACDDGNELLSSLSGLHGGPEAETAL